MPTIANPTTQI